MIYLQNKKGFSLIEVLFAFVILALTLIPLTKILHSSIPVASQSHRETVALYLAQGKLEEFKVHFEDEPPTQVFITSFDAYPGYSCTVQVERESEFLQRIVVTVNYEDAGKEKSVTLSGLNAKR